MRNGKRMLTFGGASMDTASPHIGYPRAVFTKPLPYGYLYAGMEIDPPGRAPFVRKSAKRDEALERCKAVAGRLEALGEVARATPGGSATRGRKCLGRTCSTTSRPRTPRARWGRGRTWPGGTRPRPAW